MTRYNLKISGIDIRVDKRKNYKNLNIKVINTGQVRISAPLYTKNNNIENLVKDNIDQIKTISHKYLEIYEKNKIKYENDEKVKLRGKDYILKIEKSKNNEVVKTNDNIIIKTNKPKDGEYKEKLLESFYRQSLLLKIEELIKKYSKLMDVKVSDYNIRKMKSRWGSCNTLKNKVSFNLELIKMRPSSAELVVVHELAHLIEKGHNKRFYKIIESFYPNYKQIDRYLKNYNLL